MPTDIFAGDRKRQLTEERPEELRKELRRRLAEVEEGSVPMVPGSEFLDVLLAAEIALTKRGS